MGLVSPKVIIRFDWNLVPIFWRIYFWLRVKSEKIIKITFSLENNDAWSLESPFPYIFRPFNAFENYKFSSLCNFFWFTPSQKYILQNKKVSVESDNNFWRYRSHRFENTVSRKTCFKFYVSADWPGVIHAFTSTRISTNPKHVFLKGWAFEKWNKKKSTFRPEPPLSI